MNRRQLLKSFSVLACTPFVNGCEPVKPLSIASHVWPGYELMFLAQSQGWLSNANLELLTTQSATESLLALSSAQVDGAALTLDEVLLARANGISLTIVLVFDISAGADMVLTLPEITHLSDLKGRRIGVETSALGTLMLNKLLQHAGLNSDQLTIVHLSINEQLEAWQQGKIDAVITYEPVAGKVLASGARLLFDSRQIPDTIFDVLAIRTDVAKQYKDTLKALTLAHFNTLSYFKHNPLDAAYRMAKRMELTGPETLKTFRGLELPDIHANRRYLSNKTNRLQKAATIMLEQNVLFQSRSLEGLFTDQYLPRIL